MPRSTVADSPYLMDADDLVSPITGAAIRQKCLPATADDRPESWALDGNYLGSPVLTWWEGLSVMPIVDLPDDARWKIGTAVLCDWMPPPWWYTAFGHAAMPSRAWYEWHWYRGIDPFMERRPIPKKMRAAVIERDGYVCGLCGGDVEQDDVHIDHIVPVSLGGQNELSNLQVAHSLCNIRKGNRVQ